MFYFFYQLSRRIVIIEFTWNYFEFCFSYILFFLLRKDWLWYNNSLAVYWIILGLLAFINYDFHCYKNVYRYYNHHYSTRLPNSLLEMVNQAGTCESLVMNFLISTLTQKSPIKVTTSSHFKPANSYKERIGVTFTPNTHLRTMQKCFDTLLKEFSAGELPLVLSKIAMNPVLYKDPVSIHRKKFKKLEI